MSNLFESFDPMTGCLSMNWFSLFMPFFMFFLPYWLISSRVNFIWLILFKLIFNEFKLLISFNSQSNIIVFVSLLIYIMLLNLFGLLPYVFTVTSHMSFNLILSLSLWLSFVFYGYLNFPIFVFSHLVPKNTPSFLMNFMVLIEFISNLIRPLTLSIRLTANLISGHLLMTLLGLFMSKTVFFILIFSIIIQNVLLILEISMAFIQAYVFSVLLTLYFTEFN
uniref:ATP synthase subunit a n=1 Tax=Habropoda radoszkowskii TaxID=597470 RepID=A0A7L8EYI1_9HYME|nr:ATP synthase F0 subunit 6 [Habropoda radoszkowskii]QOE17520.1 ATP synthase subunit 6 [Habropoda radoszkowskii]